jgi:hypothetical protein
VFVANPAPAKGIKTIRFNKRQMISKRLLFLKMRFYCISIQIAFIIHKSKTVVNKKFYYFSFSKVASLIARRSFVRLHSSCPVNIAGVLLSPRLTVIHKNAIIMTNVIVAANFCFLI